MTVEKSTVRTALCCECGEVRTVSVNHSPRNQVPEGWGPEDIAKYVLPEAWSRFVPWYRLLEDLKCAVCGRVTRHADVRPGGLDPSEEENAKTTAPVVTSESRGLTVLDVTGLPREYFYLPEDALVLLAADLSPADRARTVCHLLAGSFGVTVVELPNLPGEVFYVEECKVVLINSGLSPEARADALDWVLSASFV